MRMKALLHSSSTWGVITREGAALLKHLGGDNQGRGELLHSSSTWGVITREGVHSSSIWGVITREGVSPPRAPGG